MMKIGYCRSDEREEIAQLKKSGCQEVITFEPTDNAKEVFESVLDKYKDYTIIVASFSSLKLQLVQCKELFQLVQALPIDLRLLSNDFHIDELMKLSKNESAIVTERTTLGLEEARSKGRIGGRPSISRDVAKEIQFLYHNKKLPLRDIADKCDVSLGTAYKYSMI